MNYNNVSFEAAFGNPKQFLPSDVPELCFAGRSNVGKSSLINKVLGRKSFARVSTKPGKTITINFYRLENARLADLPGYGYAKISNNEKLRFAELMETYFAGDRNIKMVFSLVDMRHSPTADDIDMLEFLQNAGFPFTVVLTKCDKLNKGERAAREEALKEELAFLSEDIEKIYFSSVSGEGVAEMRSIIEKIAKENQ